MPEIVIIPPGESVPMQPTSSAFAHGFGLFETMQYAGGQIDFWSDHWARLSKSAQHFALPLPEPMAVLAALRAHVIESAPDQAILKISLMKEDAGCRLYVYSRPPIAAPEHRRLRLDASCPLFARSILAGHKTHNYMEAMHLLATAREQGFYDILRVDSQGYLAETTTANLFFIQEGRIHTPALQTGILPGVTRAALLRAQDLGIENGFYRPDTLLGAEAVFVTNATGGVQPIEQLVGVPGQKNIDFKTDTPPLRAIQSAFAQIRAEHATQLI